MILDFNKSKLFLIIGTLVGMILAVLLSFFANMILGAILFFLVYEWFLYKFSKKVALKAMNDLESVLYIQGNATFYYKQYETMILNHKGLDERWLLKKYHNIMVATLVLNDENSFYKYYNEATHKFKTTYNTLPIFNYFNTLLNNMARVVFYNKTHTKKLVEDFNSLDSNLKQQISKNPYSFHNWVMAKKPYQINETPFIIKTLEENRLKNNS